MLGVLVEAAVELVALLGTVLVAALDEAEDGLVVGDVCTVLPEVAGGAEDRVVLDVVLVTVPVVVC